MTVVKDLKERGIIRNTANIVIEETTLSAAHEIAQTVKDIAQETAKTAPQTSETVKDVANKIKSKTRKETTT
jgi:hypothetical protein